MFKINDKVIYSGFGLCKIKDIKKDKYIIVCEHNNMVIFAQKDSIRLLESKEKVRDILKSLKLDEHIKIDNLTWNRRYRDFMERLKTGEIDDIVFVYKSLNKLKLQKELSFGERKMLDQAKQLLFSEIGEVLGLDEIETSNLTYLGD